MKSRQGAELPDELIAREDIIAAESVEFATPAELREACKRATDKLEETIWEQSLLQAKLRMITDERL